MANGITADQIIDIRRIIAVPGSKGDKGDPGQQGEPGLPGVNAVDNDTAVSAYISSPASKSHAALGPLWAIVAPSGDTSGTSDTQRIQQALDSYGCVMLLQGVYHASQLTLHSGNNILALGAVVHFSQYNAIVTDTFAPDATVGDVRAHNGSAALTAADTSGVLVGDVVSVMGAGTGGSALYGTVTAKDASSFTTSVPALADAGGLTANLYRKRIHDVSITGGTWIQDKGLVWAHDPSCDVHNGLAFIFRRIDRLTLRDATFTVSTALGQTGGRFTLSIGDASNVQASNITLSTTAGDGIHFHGPASDIRIRDTYGYNTGDDLIAFGTQDGASPTIYDTAGSFSHVHIDGVHGVSSWSSVKFYDRLDSTFADEPTALYSADDITIANIYGTYKTQNISLEANLHASDITIRGDHGIPPANNPGVNVTSNHIDSLVIEASTWRKQGGNAPYLAISSPHNVTIRDLGIGSLNGNSNDLVKITGISGEYDASFRSYVTIQGVHGLKQNLSLLNVIDLRQLYAAIGDIGDVIASGYLLACCPTPSAANANATVKLAARNVTYTPLGSGSIVGAIYCNAPLLDSALTDSIYSANSALVCADDNSMTAPGTCYYNMRLSGVSNDGGSLLMASLYNVLNPHGAATKARFAISSPQTKVSARNLVPGIGLSVLNTDSSLPCGTGLLVGDGSKWINMIAPTKSYTPDYAY